ncbi:MAG TPA: hypothetical protein PLE04_10415 [Syntrophales bacterium]|mgnify:CR=1 FL=1|nr:hypothetical protein [Syntrophales bacterium]
MVKRYSNLSEDHKRSAALNLEKRLNLKKVENNIYPLLIDGTDGFYEYSILILRPDFHTLRVTFRGINFSNGH